MMQAATAAGVALPGQPSRCRHFRTQIVHASPDALTLKLHGELDLAGADVLAAVLAEYVGSAVVRLELSELSFFDCAGLRVVLAAHHRLRHDAGQLVLVNPGRCVRRVLALAQLDSVFEIVSAVGSASSDGNPW